MENKGITYDIPLTLDEDRCRHRTDHLERFFTIFKGHIYDLEFDVFNGSYNLIPRLVIFKELANLVLNLEYELPDLSNIKFKSIKFLEMTLNSSVKVLDIFHSFPNLRLLRIYNRSSEINCLSELKSLLKLEEFSELVLYNCFQNRHLTEDLKNLKKKGVDIYTKP